MMQTSSQSLFTQWLTLAQQYANAEPGPLAQNYLYACAYYQCALTEYQKNSAQYSQINIQDSIYQPLVQLKQTFINTLLEPYTILTHHMGYSEDVIQTDLKNQLLTQREIFKQQLLHFKERQNLILAELHYAEYKKIIEDANQALRNIICRLWQDAFSIIGHPPCSYALIAFGSLADGLATLHSDLEFGILISDPAQKTYFRIVAQVMQFNTLLLGETTLNILRPPEYGKPEFIELFKRCKIPNGISFDGAGEGGCKSPLGMKGLFELIETPQKFAEYLKQRDWSVTSYRTFSFDITHAAYVTGSVQGQTLFQKYKQQLRIYSQSPSQLLTQLTADLERFVPKVGRETAEGRSYAAKHDLLRLPVLAIRHLAYYFNILPDVTSNTQTIWQLLMGLQAQNKLTVETAHVLKEVVILSSLVRLEAYLTLDEQAECLTVADEQLSLTSSQKAYKIPASLRDKLYGTLLPLYDTLQLWRRQPHQLPIQLSVYRSDDPLFRGQLEEYLLHYQLASEYYQQAALPLTHSNPLQLTTIKIHQARLAGKQFDTMQTKTAKKEYKNILITYQRILGKDALMVATCHAELATQYAMLKKYDKAILAIDEALRCFILQRGEQDIEANHCKFLKRQILDMQSPAILLRRNSNSYTKDAQYLLSNQQRIEESMIARNPALKTSLEMELDKIPKLPPLLPEHSLLSEENRAELSHIILNLLKRQQTIEQFFQNAFQQLAALPDVLQISQQGMLIRQQTLLKNNTLLIHEILQHEIGFAQAQLAERISHSTSQTDLQQITAEEIIVKEKQNAATRMRADTESFKQQTKRTDNSRCPEFQLPPPLPYFTGRQTLLKNLVATLQIKKCGVISQTMAGMGGIGKTQLANYYAQMAANRETIVRYDIVIWFYAETELGYQFQAFVKIFCHSNYLNQEQAKQVFYQFLQDKVSLLVFDNAEDLEAIKDFLPPDGHKNTLHILVTSRLSDSEKWKDIPILSVSYFTLLETKNFVEQRLGSQDSILIEKLHKELGGLPLALSQAAAYIQANQCGMQAYLYLFIKQKTDLFAYVTVQDPYMKTVGVTLTLSVWEIKKINKDSGIMLDIMAYLNPDEIELDILVEFTKLQKEKALASLEILQRYSLINSDIKGNKFSVHRLVQAVIQDNDRKINSSLQMLKKIFIFLKSHFSNDDLCAKLLESKPYLPHGLYLEELFQRLNLSLLEDEHNQLLHCIGVFYLYGEREFKLGYSFFSKLLPRLRKENFDRGVVLRHFGRSCILLSNYEDAEKYLKEACDIFASRELETEKALTLIILSHMQHFKYEHIQSKKNAENAIKILSASGKYGENHIRVGIALNIKAHTVASEGCYEEAQDLYNQALKIYEKHYGKSHIQIAALLNNLGAAYRRGGKYNEAERYHKRAWGIFKLYYEDIHPDIGRTKSCLAGVYYEQQKYDNAKDSYEEALDSLTKSYEKNHPDINYALNGLANVFYKIKNYVEAINYYNQSLAIEEQLFKLRPHELACRLSNWVDAYFCLGQHQEALLHANRALKYFEISHPQELENARSLVQRCEDAIIRMNLDKRCHPYDLPPFNG